MKNVDSPYHPVLTFQSETINRGTIVNKNELTITVNSWETFNPTGFSKRYRYWFRLNSDIIHSKSLFGLTPTNKWIYICVLSAVCKEQGCPVRSSVSYISKSFDVRPWILKRALSELEKVNLLTVDWHNSDPKVDATLQTNKQTNKHNSTDKHNTTNQQNRTEQLKVKTEDKTDPSEPKVKGPRFQEFENELKRRSEANTLTLV